MSKLMILGIPMGLQFSITAIGTIIVQSAVNIYGATYMAGFSAAGKIQNCNWYGGCFYGGNDRDICRTESWSRTYGPGKTGSKIFPGSCFWYGVWLRWLWFISVVKYFTYLFISPVTDRCCAGVCDIFPYSILGIVRFCVQFFVFRNALQGMGYGMVPMLGGVFELVARTLIVVLVAGRTTFAGVCLADPMAWIAALIPLIPYYYYVMGKHMKAMRQ